MVRSLEMLKEYLSNFRSALIAFSGGVDSGVLAAVSQDVLGDDAVAITVISQVTPRREIEDARKVAEEIGIKHEFIEVDILSDENFVENTPDRCYFCKKKILSILNDFAKTEGYSAIFEGTNYDDLSEHRPGYKAVLEFQNVFSPFVELRIGKEEIRNIAKSMGLSFYCKPSLACLATRIPFRRRIKDEELRKIDEAEDFVIQKTGVSQLRIRNLDGIAVIETGRDERERLFSKEIMDEIAEHLRKIGFRRVLLDIEGYRSGKVMSLGELKDDF
ncbi:MAG: ATP-dependent sacrificial sulfur transferase LarE [Archaeoglobi archaeon]|nr:ATP-dependent sacrificial sulfur transferase LarE [Candidatus Mnemosynella sp.]